MSNWYIKLIINWLTTVSNDWFDEIVKVWTTLIGYKWDSQITTWDSTTSLWDSKENSVSWQTSNNGGWYE